MEVNVGGASPHARGDLDDLVTSLMHDGNRWAAPRTARRAVVGLGVARRPAWFRHAAPIVTRGRHAFTEAGRVHGSWRAPRGDDSRPRSPPRSWVGRHPRRFRAASRPTSRAHRYPGAAPRSRPGASASGPLALSASVSVLICLIYSSCILPLHYKTTHRRAGASPRLASARPEPACPGRKQPQNPWGASARASGRAS